MELREKLTKYLSDNIALLDCQGGCPDEVAINESLRTDNYCNKCFTDQILALIEKAGYAILAHDQSLPKSPFSIDTGDEDAYKRIGWYCCRAAMKDAGWRKIEV